ncbi:hypothetical protein AO943_36365 [Pseudomonas aeruginosa]|jgi:hypothetical protein|uniref:hypothetical protein n=1 Tax=Pseudomonas aeruginosa TaxID=287 RepID=UPI00037F0C54|nr:hypothetical protein [Pseudomonas aeruginosa]AVX92516.1 hypothetical protein PkP19E3_30455 [Pseudomonas koreensis]ERV72847.1 hypothetical protein Q041_06089 [Pseudomonas aeruginosa BWHPSA028]OWJ93723.1 hypothetical protein B6S59_16600 [Pseudomonas sp. A46]PKF24449.1 hypothetical protein CW309_21840 [Pseudomonas hunanensis]OKS21446.1 hypothetical protein BH606_09890 [Pseudomonas aeruginosa]
MSAEPSPAQTIGRAREFGALAPLNRKKIRAQFGLVDVVTADHVRRATALLLERIQDYYTVVQYTGPGYVYGRADSEWPSALYATPEFNSMEGEWSHKEMSPTHPTCTSERLFNEAGWLCLDTACRVGVYEMCLEVPEAKMVLEQARYAILSMCNDRALSETDWRSSRRRIGTRGIRKLLERLGSVLHLVNIGIGSVRPVVMAPGSTLAGLKHITDWSMGSEPGRMTGHVSW